MSSKMCELLYKNIFGAFQIVSGLKKKLNFFIGGWASLIQSSVIIIVQDFFQGNPFNVTLLDSLFKT